MDYKLASEKIEEIKSNLKKIPETHHQEALDNSLYQSLLTPNKLVIENLLELGANPNGSSTFQNLPIILAYAAPDKSVFDLLLVENIEIPSILVEQIIENNDLKTFNKIKPFLKKMYINIAVPEQFSELKPFLLHDKIEEEKKEETIYLPSLEYPYFDMDYEVGFIIDGKKWDSVSRYLMYKLYEGTPKGDTIKNEKNIKEAKRIFNIKKLKPAENAKQILKNKNLEGIANSKFNKNSVNKKTELFYDANYQKFIQNNLLKNKLLNTGGYIIDKNVSSLGYEGNLLGNTLMRIRANLNSQKQFEIIKTNNLTIKKYGKAFVIRGDPDEEISNQIRGLGNFKKGSKLIYGKLNFNLSGGPGWLIPSKNSKEAKKIVFATMPNSEKLRDKVKKWTKEKLRIILGIAGKISGDSIGSDDVMFVIKDLLRCGIFFGKDIGEPDVEFSELVIQASPKEIGDVSIKILWDFFGEMIRIGFSINLDIPTFDKLVEEYSNALINKPVKKINGLTDREVIFIEAFKHTFNTLLIKKEKKGVILLTLNILLKPENVKEIKKTYNERIKKSNGAEPGSEQEEKVFKDRFKIKNEHIQKILDYLNESGMQDKKIKLLILISLDYILSFEDLDLIKNLLMFI